MDRNDTASPNTLIHFADTDKGLWSCSLYYLKKSRGMYKNEGTDFTNI